MSPEPSPPVSAPSKPAQWLLFLACAIGGGLLGAAVARWGLRSDGPLSIGWLLLVIFTLAMLPLGRWQRRMVREGKVSSATVPRPALYLQTTLMWLGLLVLGFWVLRGNAAPFDRSAFAWPTGAAAFIAFGVVGAIIAGLAYWARLLPTSRRRRAWLRAVYRHGVSLIAPRTLRELTQFRAMVCLTSTAEEVVYRVAIPGGFVALWGLGWGRDADAGAMSAWVAAALAAALFGMAHAWQGWFAVLWTTAFGLIAAALTLGSGSVWPAVALHVAWNLMVAGIAYTVYRGPSPDGRRAAQRS
jgi:membrane protease YdiL (CAAX protease family)